MATDSKNKLLTGLAQTLDIPDAAYETAQNRYHDLGEWLSDPSKAKSARFQPLVFPQGSFRLGTVTKPWKREEYDLDLTCKLQIGISTATFTQQQLKQLVGNDLTAYRVERGIEEKIEEKHRCWRLNYKDHLQFHMDTVPCIPHTENVRLIIQERMMQAGTSEPLAHNVAELAVAITDDRLPSYRQISEDWQISNPEGYANWFESKMKLAQSLLEARALQAKVAQVEDLPVFRWKTPLQMAIQILKRHRDVMYEHDPDTKPISIILTTLAASAYKGELDLSATLEQILKNMQVNPLPPRVPNPVNPQEDFADKWRTLEGRRLRLEENFFFWLTQAKKDIELLVSQADRVTLQDHVRKRFGITINDEVFGTDFKPSTSKPSSPAVHIIRDAPKPWCR